MKALDYFGDFVFFDHEGQVNFRRALGDHADFFIGEFTEYMSGDAWRLAEIFPYQAHDGFAAFIFHVGELGQIGRRDFPLVFNFWIFARGCRQR